MYSAGENDNAGVPYFFNCTTGQSVWTHPNEKLYFEKVKIAKEQLKLRDQSNAKSGFSGPKVAEREATTSLPQESSHGFRPNNRNSSRFSDDNKSDNEVDDEVLDFSDIDDANSDAATGTGKNHNYIETTKTSLIGGANSNGSDASKKKMMSSGFGLTDEDFLDNENGDSATSNVSNLSGYGSSSSPQRQGLSATSQNVPNRSTRDQQNHVNRDESFHLTSTSPDRRDSEDESFRDDSNRHGGNSRPVSRPQSNASSVTNRPSLSVAFEDDDRRWVGPRRGSLLDPTE